MPVSKKQQACVNRYMSKNYDRINIVVPKGERDRYKAAASDLGLSVNQLFVTAVEEFIADRLALSSSRSPSASSDTSENSEE